MTPVSEDEALIARVLVDALRGQLRLGILDYARVATAANRVRADRIAPLALTAWLARDPAAAAIMRQSLRRSPPATPGR